MRRRHVPTLALFLGVFLLYRFSFSSVPTADGSWYISNIDRSDFAGILIAHSPLSGYFFFTLKRLLAGLGLSVGTLPLIQTVNALVAALETVLLYRVIKLLGGRALLGVLGGALLGVSFGLWYFANGEFQHLSLGVLLLIFYLILRARMTGRAYGYRFVVALALLNAVAVLFRQESFLFGFVAVAMLMVGCPWRRGLREGLVYALAGSLGTAALVVAVGVFLVGARTLEDFGRWYFWLFEYLGAPQEYRSFESARLPVVGALKGQLTAFIFGTQVVVDALRRSVLLRYARVDALAGLTVLAYVAIGALLAVLWRTRKPIRDHYLVPLIGCVVWLVSYTLLLHSWFWPTVTKYHIVTLPPLILLLLLGPIAARTEPFLERRLRARESVIILLVALSVVNFLGGILPWYRYGEMKESLRVTRQTAFRSDDLFVSSESGIDGIFHEGGRYLSLKGIFKRASKKDGFELIRSAIDEQLRNGRRVFLYNFVPGPFTLIGINQFAQGGDQFTPRDFEDFLADVRARYGLRPVFSYWEESKSPLYLYGAQLETFWEVTRGP